MGEKLLTLWQYIRGDMTTEAFENFIYNEPGLEELLGKEQYLEAISANYNDKESLHNVFKKIEVFANTYQDYLCQCHCLRDKETTDMGWKGEGFSTFEIIKRKSKTKHWLYVSQCSPAINSG